jgi:glyoxylase-like metal-dependent hydrolase (beta-lactamase superfamily II)
MIGVKTPDDVYFMFLRFIKFIKVTEGILMYELIQADENTFYIDCPAKMGVYRLPDNKVILIDSGHGKEAGKKVLKIFDDNGWALDTIINTHSNADHIGGNKLLSDRTGCKIYAPGMESAFCNFPILEPSFLYGGFPSKQLRNKFLFAEPSPVNNIAEMTLPQGMEIFPLKGHFFDMIGVKTPDDVYFMADCVSSETIINKYHITFIYDVSAYLNTLDIIKTLKGKLFIPAHADALNDMNPLADLNKKKVLEIIERIQHICERPVSFEEVLKALFDEYHLVMDFNQYVLVGSTVRSYLSYMLDNQILNTDFQDNKLLWCLMR